MNNTFLLFYSPKPRSQVCILIYRKLEKGQVCLVNISYATVVLTEIMDVIRHFVKVGLHFLFSHVALTLSLLMKRLNILPCVQANSQFVKFSLSKEAKRKSLLMKVSFLCVRITNHFHIIRTWHLASPRNRGLGLFGNGPLLQSTSIA